MTTQETVRVRADLIFTTDSGEVPDKPGLERLISDQMSGELDDETGLGCMAVTVLEVTGELEVSPRRLIAHFTPQAWVRNYAVDADPEGDPEWDCTREVHEGMSEEKRTELLATLDANEEIDDDWLDRDDWLHSDPDAPEWVREWRGPFDIHVRYADG